MRSANLSATKRAKFGSACLSLLLVLLVLSTGRARASCGDGVVEPVEECDDGGLAEGDGCSALCAFECSLTGTWYSTYSSGQVGAKWDIVEEPAGVVRGFLHAAPLPGGVSGTRGSGRVTLSFLCNSEGGCSTLDRALTNCDTLPLDTGALGTLVRAANTACGNAILESGEECDDGDWINGDSCTEDCRAAICGNGIVELGEECDDGNLVDADGCTAGCASQVCGNGEVEPGEACDDGNSASNDGCASCQLQVCGNAILEPSEQCDDGNALADDGCSPMCVTELPCTLTGTWQSTYAGLPPAAALKWQFIEDSSGGLRGTLRAGLIAFAINGWRSGTMVDLSLCNLGGCVSYRRGLLDCDRLPIDTSLFGGLQRVSNAVCGNGALEAGEECDSGNFAGSEDCTAMCRRPWCGNGIVDALEECDDGNEAIGDGCAPNCTAGRCGNGIVDPNEQCDDGNLVDGDGCGVGCALPDCPNSIVDVGEECDDGNALDGDGCARNCRLPGCGNGILEDTEQCDDGALLACDGCDASCQREGDADGDSVFGACDDCPADYNPSPLDRDQNGVGDVCDVPLSLATSVGSNVSVGHDEASFGAVIRGIRINYAAVGVAGTTDVRQVEAPPGMLLDANFKLSPLGTLLHLDTTAEFSGPIRVCVTYGDDLLGESEADTLMLLHEESGVLVDRTASVGVGANEICADVASFSSFVIGARVGALTRLRGRFKLVDAPLAGDRLTTLKMRLTPGADQTIDPTATGMSVSVFAGNEQVFRRTIPAARWRQTRARAFRFSDSSGVQVSGLKRATVVRTRSGEIRIALRGRDLDLHGLNAAALRFRADFGGATYAATAICSSSAGARTGVRCDLP